MRANSLGIRIGAALLLVSAACTGAGSPPPEGLASAGAFEEAACGLPPPQLQRVRNGFDPERSGEVQIVPRAPNLVGRSTLSHAGPWAYLQRVPMLLYGPGHVPAVGSVKRPVTMADVAPTLARYLDFDFDAPDGKPMEEAVVPDADPPRLILVVVWDGGGRNVLETYPDGWPNLSRLIPRGAWYDRATLGTSPSITPPVHATLGTGAFPRKHGLMDLRFKVGDGLVPPTEKGPQYFLEPTLADLYDEANGNEPIVGVVAAETWHLAMGGHGSYLDGGDRDLAALRAEQSWSVEGENAKYFEFPSYVNEVTGLEEAVRELDLQDGALDNTWLGERMLDEPRGPTMTPAFAVYQTKVLEEVIRREGFGADETPDLLFTNYKEIDKVAHRWTMNSPQMEAVVEADDAELPKLIELLDREVGKGEWVMVLTADHGETPAPEVSGGFLIDHEELKRDAAAAFDDDGDDRKAFLSFRVNQIWVNERELSDNGFTLQDVAQFLLDYTKEQNVGDPSSLPEAERDDRIFSAAFPGSVLTRNLPCLAKPGG